MWQACRLRILLLQSPSRATHTHTHVREHALLEHSECKPARCRAVRRAPGQRRQSQGLGPRRERRVGVASSLRHTGDSLSEPSTFIAIWNTMVARGGRTEHVCAPLGAASCRSVVMPFPFSPDLPAALAPRRCDGGRCAVTLVVHQPTACGALVGFPGAAVRSTDVPLVPELIRSHCPGKPLRL